MLRTSKRLTYLAGRNRAAGGILPSVALEVIVGKHAANRVNGAGPQKAVTVAEIGWNAATTGLVLVLLSAVRAAGLGNHVDAIVTSGAVICSLRYRCLIYELRS